MTSTTASARHATSTTSTATTNLIARTELELLAERIADDGIAAHHDEVVTLIRASGLGTRFPVLSDLVIDGTAPPVARERAIGRLAALAARPAASPVSSTSSARSVWRPRAA